MNERLTHAAEICDEAANYLSDEHILPCDEGNAIAENLATAAMNLRETARNAGDTVLLRSENPGEDCTYTIGAVVIADATQGCLDRLQAVCDEIYQTVDDCTDEDLLDELTKRGYVLGDVPGVLVVR